MMKHWMAAGLVVAAAQAADAAVITVEGTFTATDWSVYFGTPSAPIDPLFLDYSATFDDELTYEDDASIVTVNATNIPYAFNFSYSPDGGTIILATDGNSGSCSHPASSFCAFIGDFATGVAYFVEQSPADGGGWVAGTITSGIVPEPASWAMLIAGFGLIGASLRRRHGLTA